MFDIIISIIVLIAMGYSIPKNYKPQVMLAVAGILLMTCGVWLGFGGVLDPIRSNGYLVVDIYNEILRILSNRIFGLGLLTMAVDGYACYIECIGASHAMANLLGRLLKLIRSPYIILSVAYAVGQIMAQFTTSASGLDTLLMVALFPTLVSLRVSRPSVVAVIATAMSIKWGILETSSIFTARTVGMKTVTHFFHYQLPVASCAVIPMVISYFFVQCAFDKKGRNINHEQAERKTLNNVPPLYYVVLPVMPLILVLNLLFLAHVGLVQSELHLVVVMLLSSTTTTFVKFFRRHSLCEAMDDVQVFFDGMGTQFVNVVTLVVVGEIPAKGLATISTAGAVIRGARHSDLSGIGVMIIMTLVITIYAIVMGSGNAPLMSFASLIPGIAAGLHVPAVVMIVPMHFATALARTVSPITAVVAVMSETADVLPFAVMRQITIPMTVGFVVNMVATITLSY